MRPDNPLPNQFETAKTWVRLVGRTDPVAADFVTCAISGPGGLGKTHLVETTLREMGVRFKIARGSAAALLQAAFEYRSGGVLVIDDADNLILGGGGNMNYMKQLLTPSTPRWIVNDTIGARKNQGKQNPNRSVAPPRFQTRCGVIWLTNLDIGNAQHVDPKVSAHLQPLVDRGLKPVRLSSHPLDILEYVIWLTTEHALLKRKGLSLIEENEALHYFVENAWRFQSLSVRTLENVASLRKAEPMLWRDILNAGLLPAPQHAIPLPPIPQKAKHRDEMDAAA